MPRSVETCDVAIIGGGASGLAAAVCAARAGARVIVVERDAACGLPILATGNGRCNISNESLDPRHYSDDSAARAVFGGGAEERLDAFFASLGIMTTSTDGRLYPVTRRAESVRDALLGACGREGVEVRCGLELVAATRTSGRWRLELNAPARSVPARSADKGDLRRARKTLEACERRPLSIEAASVVVAVGGRSSEACGLFGLPHNEEEPLLTPIACEPVGQPGALADLDGLRVECMLCLKRDGAAIAYESGEVLFRAYGISGIAAFNLSRRCRPEDVIELDLFPDRTDSDLESMLRGREAALGAFTGNPAWFDGLLARPLAALACASTEGARDRLAAVAAWVHRIPLRVQGRCEPKQAQVRRGGVPLADVELPSCRVATAGIEGLFVCGEALDMDADCGGFNLAWAWTTGMNAGAAAAQTR